ncbi:hypothetical protein V1478_006187 [Vespula squamosa]|uniref:Uncharacterized protein n=1 Tax=Vespula squamosa TaxID=30214 RepID=A0ABD2B760_VESSQ
MSVLECLVVLRRVSFNVIRDIGVVCSYREMIIRDGVVGNGGSSNACGVGDGKCPVVMVGVPQRVNPRVQRLYCEGRLREELSGFTASAMFEHLMAGICLARQDNNMIYGEGRNERRCKLVHPSDDGLKQKGRRKRRMRIRIKMRKRRRKRRRGEGGGGGNAELDRAFFTSH